MKRIGKQILSVLLICAVLFVPSVFNAQSAGRDKMSAKLQQKVDQMTENEKTDVYFLIKSGIMYDAEYDRALDRRVLDEMGLTSVPIQKYDPEGYRQFMSLRRAMLNYDMEKYQRELIALLDVPEEDIVSVGGQYSQMRLTASQILLACEQDYVLKMQTIRCDLDEDFEKTIVSDDPLINCIADQYDVTDADQIQVDYRIATEKGFIVRYHVEGYALPDSMMEHSLNRFMLWDFEYPEPELYITGENRLLELSAAYVQGYVSEREMEYFADHALACVYYTGDINRDKQVNILDVTELQRILANMQEKRGFALCLGDVDVDYELTVNDATLIQRYLAEYITSF